MQKCEERASERGREGESEREDESERENESERERERERERGRGRGRERARERAREREFERAREKRDLKTIQSLRFLSAFLRESLREMAWQKFSEVRALVILLHTATVIYSYCIKHYKMFTFYYIKPLDYTFDCIKPQY